MDESLKIAATNIHRYHIGTGALGATTILFDRDKAPLANALAAVLREGNSDVTMTDVSRLGASEGGSLIDTLLDDPNRYSVVLCSNEMWQRTSIRTRFTMLEGAPTLESRNTGIFFDAVTPIDSLRRLYGPQYASGVNRLQELQSQLPVDAPIRVSTPSGTDITCISRQWQTDEWFEIHTSPIEDTANGTIVADLACPFGRLVAPLRLTIRLGRLVGIVADDPDEGISRMYLEDMRRHLHDDGANHYVAEIGLGANADAQPSESIMESESVDGTVHFCFGDNSRYGGSNSSNWHGGTIVCQSPTVKGISC